MKGITGLLRDIQNLSHKGNSGVRVCAQLELQRVKDKLAGLTQNDTPLKTIPSAVSSGDPAPSSVAQVRGVVPGLSLSFSKLPLPPSADDEALPSPWPLVDRVTEFKDLGDGVLLGGSPGHTGRPFPVPEFAQLVDLAAETLGGEVIFCTNDFFAAMDNLVKATPPVWDADLMTERGKWMDGWESQRHNKLGVETAIIQLGAQGFIHGFCVDTSHFSGNHAPSVSVEVLNVTDKALLPFFTKPELDMTGQIKWKQVLPKTACIGCYENFFELPEEFQSEAVTHVKLCMYPDGGIARFKAFGNILPNFLRYLKENETLDLALITNGGLVTACSNSHFSSKDNIIMPFLSKSMKDGWETKRSRQRNHSEWSVIQLGCAGYLQMIEIDTRHFKGNSPDFVSIEGALFGQNESEAPDPLDGVLQNRKYTTVDQLSQLEWKAIAEKESVVPHRRNYFTRLENRGPFSHIRITIFPDGGISRVRVFGYLVDPSKMKEDHAGPLCSAAFRRDLASLKALTKGKANLNSADYDKRTALHVAASEGFEDIVRFLLANGALVLQDRWGNTPRDDATRCGYSHLLSVFDEYS